MPPPPAGLNGAYFCSLLAEHKFCVNLLKAYGILAAILFISDALSLGGILGQVNVYPTCNRQLYLRRGYLLVGVG